MSVFVIQQPRPGPKGFTYDISPALEFGSPIMIFDSSAQPSLTPGPAAWQARQTLKDFNHESDYILWAGGDPYGIALVTATLSQLGFKSYNFLRWERDSRTRQEERRRGWYVSVRLDLRGMA